MRSGAPRAPGRLPLALAALPVHPVAFLVLAGLRAVRSPGMLRGAPFGRAVVAFALLGLASQLGALLLGPPGPSAAPPAEAEAGADSSDGPNLMPRSRLSHLRPWNEDGPGPYAEPLADGFWRLPRVDAASGAENEAFLTYVQHDVRPGRTYVQSVHYRHDGTAASFELAVRLPDGTRLRPTTTHERVAEGLHRAHATFAVPEGVERIRALHLAQLGGDWSRLDLGLAQLEEGTRPRPYRPFATRPPLAEGVAWWLLLGALTWAGLAYGAWLARERLAGRGAWLLLAGLSVQAGVAVADRLLAGGARADGLFAHPNLLGHLALACAGAAWALRRGAIDRVAVAALGAGLVVVLASGSRMALLALAVLVLAGAGRALLGRRWRAGGGAVLLALAAAAVLVTGGERFDDAVAGGLEAGRERAAAWRAAFDAFERRPLVGIGHGAFDAHYDARVPDAAGPLPLVRHAHGLLPSVLAEGGLTGLIALLSLWIPIVLTLVRRSAWPALTLVAAVGLANVGDATFYFGGVYLPLLAVVGWAARADGPPDPAAPAPGGAAA